jgi:lipopolysaccharide/colanic/teichoic acid biosynthesis glycosyltransferase
MMLLHRNGRPARADTHVPLPASRPADEPRGPVVRRDPPHPRPGTPTAARWYRRHKPLTDGALALALCVPAAPVVLLAAALVKVTSPGPSVFRQRRLGRGGRVFTIYKLRTMNHECERLSGPRWSTHGDPRVTGVGRVLRRLHVDELPQLWNVLRGDMSLVGPRPERPEFLPGLKDAFPDYERRLEVRPGITGLAQIQLPADTDLNSVRRKLACDIYYVEHESAWLDLRILLATGGKVFGVPFAWTGAVLRIPNWLRARAVLPDTADRLAGGPHARLSGAAGAS